MESEFRPRECSSGDVISIVQHGVAYQRRRFCPPTTVADEASNPPICAAYPSSISSLTSCVRLTPPTVRTILAGSFSLPLRRPASIASRTAFSISRCEVMPTFFRNLRRLALKTSSFMVASGLRFDHTLVTAWHEPLSFDARKRSHLGLRPKMQPMKQGSLTKLVMPGLVPG